MSITAARLIAEVKTEGTGAAASALHGFGGAVDKVQHGIGVGMKVATVAGAAGMALLGKATLDGVRSLADQEKQSAQTAAAIKSTGGAAHVTVAQVDQLSNALENKTTIDNKVVQSGANVLLTFTNVRNEVGAGNDIFNQATAAALDMATALGKDAPAASMQLGKALNDPIRGISILSRSGVAFTAQQKEQIKTLVASGHTMEAQKIILGELSKEFGGSAAAAGNTFQGTLRRVGDAVEGVEQSLARALMPALDKVATKANAFLRDPAVLARVDQFGTKLAGMVTDENIGRIERVGKAGLSAFRTIAEWGGRGVGAAKRLWSDVPWVDVRREVGALGTAAKIAFGQFREGVAPVHEVGDGLREWIKQRGGQKGFWDTVGKGMGALTTKIGTIDWKGIGTDVRGLFGSIHDTASEFSSGGGLDRSVDTIKGALTGIPWREVADSALDTAKGFQQIATAVPWDVVRSTMPIATEAMREALSLYDSLDPAMKAAVVTAYAVNKVTGGAFTDLVGQGIKAGIAAATGGGGVGGLLGGILGRGSTKYAPMYVTVTNPGFGPETTPGPDGVVTPTKRKPTKGAEPTKGAGGLGDLFRNLALLTGFGTAIAESAPGMQPGYDELRRRGLEDTGKLGQAGTGSFRIPVAGERPSGRPTRDPYAGLSRVTVTNVSALGANVGRALDPNLKGLRGQFGRESANTIRAIGSGTGRTVSKLAQLDARYGREGGRQVTALGRLDARFGREGGRITSGLAQAAARIPTGVTRGLAPNIRSLEARFGREGGRQVTALGRLDARFGREGGRQVTALGRLDARFGRESGRQVTALARIPTGVTRGLTPNLKSLEARFGREGAFTRTKLDATAGRTAQATSRMGALTSQGLGRLDARFGREGARITGATARMGALTSQGLLRLDGRFGREGTKIAGATSRMGALTSGGLLRLDGRFGREGAKITGAVNTTGSRLTSTARSVGAQHSAKLGQLESRFGREGARIATTVSASGRSTGATFLRGQTTVAGEVRTSTGVQRAILAKKRDVTVNVKPGAVTLRLDGRAVASAVSRYLPGGMRIS